MYRFLLKPCHPKELQMTILQGLQHKKLVAQSRKLLQEHQKTVNILEELEKANPGITKIEMDEDGAIMMEDEASRKASRTCSRCSTISRKRWPRLAVDRQLRPGGAASDGKV